MKDFEAENRRLRVVLETILEYQFVCAGIDNEAYLKGACDAHEVIKAIVREYMGRLQ